MGALYENRIYDDDPALGSRVAHRTLSGPQADARRCRLRLPRRGTIWRARPKSRCRVVRTAAKAIRRRPRSNRRSPCISSVRPSHHAPSRRAPRSAVPRTASPRSAPPSLPTRSSPCARTATHRETTGTPWCPRSTTRTPLTWSSTPSGPSTCESQAERLPRRHMPAERRRACDETDRISGLSTPSSASSLTCPRPRPRRRPEWRPAEWCVRPALIGASS